MARDMTQGPIARGLIAFSIPLVLSGLLQQMYSWADALIVGNFIGEGPLAAVGATGIVSNLGITVLSGFAAGVSILVAQTYGRGEGAKVSKIAGTFTALIGLAALALSALGFVFTIPLLRLLETPADIMTLSASYLRIIFVGIPFLALYNITSAVLRGIGDSRTPLLAIGVSSAANILLDLLFVAVLGWGIEGAAWATVAAQAAMVVFLFAYIRRRVPLAAFSLSRGLVDRAALKEGLRLGLPNAVQYGIRGGGSLMLQNVQNGFGSTVVAAISSAYRIDTVTLLPVINMGSGVSTFAGQNWGAGNMERGRRGLKLGAALAFAIAVVVTALIVPLGGKLLGIFGISAQGVAIGWEFLRLLAVFYPLYGLYCVLAGYLQGLGDVYFVSGVNLAALGVRVGISYAMRGAWGHRVIAWAEMICWVFSLALVGGRYWFKFRAGRRQVLH